MNKRGQITLFLIVALVLVLVFGLLFYIRSNSVKDLSGNVARQDINSLNIYISQCLYDVGKEGIFNLSQHGGFYNEPGSFTSVDGFILPNYYNKGISTVPSRAVLESELEDYIDDHLKECVDLSFYEDQGYKIQQGRVTSDVIIFDDRVSFTMDFPITAIKGTKEKKFQDYNAEIDITYGKLVDISKSIVQEIAKNPDYRPLSFFLSLDIEPNVIPLNDYTDIYVLIDPNIKMRYGEDLLFTFTAVFK